MEYVTTCCASSAVLTWGTIRPLAKGERWVNALHCTFSREEARTYCAPVSRARLRMSDEVPLTRMIGLTPRAEMAATELCIESSPMFPCSQSTMIP